MKNESKKGKFGLGEDKNIYRIESKANGTVLLTPVSIESEHSYIIKDEDFIKQESDSLILTKTSDGSVKYSLS